MKKKLSISIVLFFVTFSTALFINNLVNPLVSVSPYPNGLNFAFTITDDPDDTKLVKLKPIYSLLDKLGYKTTIACWIFKPTELENMPDPEEQMQSVTVEDSEYLQFLKHYQNKGFEIALHTVTAGHDKREMTIKGYERFMKIFGRYPAINIMHSKNKENIYWGKNIFKNKLIRFLISFYDNGNYAGEACSSPYFWGDICKEKTKYIRLWGTSDINTLKFNPSMPYHDEQKPLVNYWFSFSDGYSAKYFKKLITKKNVDKLIRERGSCIVYTHFSASFCQKQADGTYIVDKDVKSSLEYVAKQKQGWFVSAGEVLDRLLDIKNVSLSKNGGRITVSNLNRKMVKGITLKTMPYLKYTDELGKISQANEEGEISLGDMSAGEKRTITFNQNLKIMMPALKPGIIEKFRLVRERLRIMIFSHRG